MKHRNPKFGCLKIAQQISHAFGIEVNKDVVRRILQQHYAGLPHGNGRSWLTALAHAKDSLWSLDPFRCESILLQSCWVMVIIDVFSQRFIGFAVARGDIDGPAVCRMFNCATAKQGLPKYLSTDHDPLFRFHRWLANLRILEIEEVKSVPYAPVSHPFFERMIRTIRREYLDRRMILNSHPTRARIRPFRIRLKSAYGAKSCPPGTWARPSRKHIPAAACNWAGRSPGNSHPGLGHPPAPSP